MQVTGLGTAIVCADPQRASRLFTEHLGFEVTVALDWYVDLVHPGVPASHLAFLAQGHAAVPEALRSTSADGVFVTLVVEDVVAEVERLTAAGATRVGEIVDAPWGQRRAFLRGGDRPLVELVQPVPPDPAWLEAQGLTMP